MKFFSFILKYWRIFALVAIVLPIVAGSFAYMNMPREGDPEVDVPVVVVSTIYPGAAPAEIESLITIPIEKALEGLEDIDEIRSGSVDNVSMVITRFEVNADIDEAIREVREAVSDEISNLPDGAREPIITEVSFSNIPLLIISVKGDYDPVQLKDISEDIADDLEQMPEVLETIVTGGLTREIQINLDPSKVEHYGLSILEVIKALQASHLSIPGGSLTVGQSKYQLRPLSEVKEIREFADLAVSNVAGRLVHLGDIAAVVDGFSEERTYARVDGTESVSISVKKRQGANILETSNKIRARLEELAPKLPAGVSTEITADRAKWVKQDFELMTNSAVSGLVIVILVLYLFMGFRNALITGLAIPLSLTISFMILYLMGISNNSMVRFSIVLCIGMLVDNAIVIAENAYHHLQRGKSKSEAVVVGTSEIALPVLSATLTTVSAFLPLLLMTGVLGKFMGFMPKTVSVALMASMVVAMVANPIILSRFIKLKSRRGGGGPVPVEQDLARFKSFYERLIIWAINRRYLVVAIAVAVFCLALAIPGANLIEVDMFPDVDWDYIYIDAEAPTGTDVDVTDSIARQVEEVIRANVPEAVRVVTSVGRRGASAYEVFVTEAIYPHYAEVVVELLDAKEHRRPKHTEIMKRIRPYLDAIPGAEISFRPVEWGPPKDAPIAVKIVGDDIPTLRRISQMVIRELEDIEGSAEIKDDFSDATPELRLHIDREKASSLGVSLQSAVMTLRAAFAGYEAVEFRDEAHENDAYDVIVRYDRSYRRSIEDVSRLKVRSLAGELVPLRSLVEMETAQGLHRIRRIDLERVVRVTAQNRGRSAVEITEELRERLERKVDLPEGYRFSYAGDFEQTEESFESLKVAYMVAFILILAILVSQFNSFIQPFAILTTLPLSLVGAMIGLWVTGNSFTIMSFIGLVGLSGIVVNGAIVLVDWINNRRQAGVEIVDAIVQAGRDRLRPIMSTTVTTIGGLLTLTITDELWEGLGVVIIFGIAFATLLTLVMVPVIYYILEGLGQRMRAAVKPPDVFREFRPGMYSWSRRRWVKPVAAIVLVGQVVLLAFGVSGWIWPMAVERFSTPILASSALKLFLEVGIKYAIFAINVAVKLVALLTPSWLLLAWVAARRGAEREYLVVGEEALTIHRFDGALRLPWSQVDSVKAARWSNRIVIWSGRRRLVVGPLLKGPPETGQSLAQWVKAAAPPSGKLKSAVESCLWKIESKQ